MANLSDSSVDPDEQHLLDVLLHGQPVPTAVVVLALVTVVLGAIFNIAAIFGLVRRRLWNGHEGHLYLLAIFVGNLVVVSLVFGPQLHQLFHHSSSLETISHFACKFLRFFQGAWLSAAWFVVALLVGVLLRGHAASEPASPPSCCRKLAAGYCTALGSKIVIAGISLSFALMNMWTLWSVKVKPLAPFNISNTSRLSLFVCDVDPESFYLQHTLRWSSVSELIMLYVPVALILPVMWILVLWLQRKRNTVARSDDDDVYGSREFSRMSLIVGAVVFATQFPRVVTEIIHVEIFSNHHVFLAYRLAHMLSTACVVLVPICCIVCVERMRNDVREMFVCRKCCPTVVVGDEGGSGASIMPLEYTAQNMPLDEN